MYLQKRSFIHMIFVINICLFILLPAFADNRTVTLQEKEQKQIVFETGETIMFKFHISKIGSCKFSVTSESTDQISLGMGMATVQIKKDQPFVMFTKKTSPSIDPGFSFTNLTGKKTDAITIELSEVIPEEKDNEDITDNETPSGTETITNTETLSQDELVKSNEDEEKVKKTGINITAICDKSKLNDTKNNIYVLKPDEYNQYIGGELKIDKMQVSGTTPLFISSLPEGEYYVGVEIIYDTDVIKSIVPSPISLTTSPEKYYIDDIYSGWGKGMNPIFSDEDGALVELSYYFIKWYHVAVSTKVENVVALFLNKSENIFNWDKYYPSQEKQKFAPDSTAMKKIWEDTSKFGLVITSEEKNKVINLLKRGGKVFFPCKEKPMVISLDSEGLVNFVRKLDIDEALKIQEISINKDVADNETPSGTDTNTNTEVISQDEIVKRGRDLAKSMGFNPIPVYKNDEGHIIIVKGTEYTINNGEWALAEGDMLINVGSDIVQAGDIEVKRGEYAIVANGKIKKGSNNLLGAENNSSSSNKIDTKQQKLLETGPAELVLAIGNDQLVYITMVDMESGYREVLISPDGKTSFADLQPMMSTVGSTFVLAADFYEDYNDAVEIGKPIVIKEPGELAKIKVFVVTNLSGHNITGEKRFITTDEFAELPCNLEGYHYGISTEDELLYVSNTDNHVIQIHPNENEENTPKPDAVAASSTKQERFIVNDTTINDTETGLVWSKNGFTSTDILLSVFPDAEEGDNLTLNNEVIKKFLAKKKVEDKIDWRLPTDKDIESLKAFIDTHKSDRIILYMKEGGDDSQISYIVLNEHEYLHNDNNQQILAPVSGGKSENESRSESVSSSSGD